MMFFIVGVPSSWVKRGGGRISPLKKWMPDPWGFLGDSSIISTQNCDFIPWV